MPSTKFFFWNINNKPLTATIAALVVEHAVDVLILAESIISDGVLVQALNSGPRSDFHLAPNPLGRMRIFTRFSRQFFQAKFESKWTTIARIALPARDEILLCAVHFPSKLHLTDASQAQEASILASEIVREEDNAGHQRTLLVGDLNMNPFEHGVVALWGFTRSCPVKSH